MAGDLSESTIRAALGGRPFRFLEETGSTNDDALAWADEGALEGAVVVAEQQTAGRGRWGRTWLSEPGLALMFSIVLRPRLALERVGLVTTALGTACAQAITDATDLPVRLKWPNDLTVNGQKLAGLLVESRITADGIEAAAGGVGVNVMYRREELPDVIATRATSLAIEMDRAPPTRPDLLAAMLNSFSGLYPSLDEAALLERASALSDVIGGWARVRFADGRTIEGRALRLVGNGALELDTESGVTTVDSGEVETFRSG
jgi:BirA family transcriptional regulator, biotin operon repressor / biotin---[acetyl-CoA-carboxylase] ligase